MADDGGSGPLAELRRPRSPLHYNQSPPTRKTYPLPTHYPRASEHRIDLIQGVTVACR